MGKNAITDNTSDARFGTVKVEQKSPRDSDLLFLDRWLVIDKGRDVGVRGDEEAVRGWRIGKAKSGNGDADSRFAA
jgi:hypothetical protein